MQWINLHFQWKTLKICPLNIFNLWVVLLFEKSNPIATLLSSLKYNPEVIIVIIFFFFFLIRGSMAQINQCDLTCRYISCFLPPLYLTFVSSGICSPEINRSQLQAAGSLLLQEVPGQGWETRCESGPTASPLAFAKSCHSVCGLWFMHPIGGNPRNFWAASDN